MVSKQTILPDNRDELLYVKRLHEGTPVYCGYKREYLARNLSEMEEGFVTCSVCTGITRQATFYKGETTCLTCSVSQTEFNPVKLVQNAVDRLDIKCPLMRKCTWNGILSEAESHLDNCTTFLIQCELCEVSIERDQYFMHETLLCPFYEMKCEHCGVQVFNQELDGHYVSCPEYPISCPVGCGEVFLRRQLHQHKSKCLLGEITCPYKDYGCNVSPMLRRDLLAHKKEFYIEHQDMSLNEIQELNNEITDLHREQHDLYCGGRTMMQLDGVEWEIQNVNALKRGEEVAGPTIDVDEYALKIYLIIVHRVGYGINLGFTLKRVEGQLDSMLGDEFITNYRLVLVNETDVSESITSQGTMSYDLKIGKYSDILKFGTITWTEYYSCLTADESLLVRLYFEVNSKEPTSRMISQELAYEEDLTLSNLPITYRCVMCLD